MKTAVLAIHAVGVAAVISLSAFEGWRAVTYYGEEYLALTYARTLPAVLCGFYALAHAALLIRRRVTTQALLWFYPLCLSLGLVAGLVARCYGKGWAPADALEARQANIIGFGVVAILWLGALFSCYRAWSSHEAHGA